MIHTMLFITAAFGTPGGPSGPSIVPELIDQLGSNKFVERQEAAKELEAIGEPALEQLRVASTSRDPEVRSRAGRLATRIQDHFWENEFKRIMKSELSPEEKGRELLKLYQEGLPPEQLRRWLGKQSAVHSYKYGFSLEYSSCCLMISYGGEDVRIISVDHTGDIKESR